MRRKADYTLMRCLYCGKELALLKRLTGGGEFCSDTHKQSYQEEYNRLALSRLLNAQKKTDKPEKTPAEKPEKAAKSHKEQVREAPAPQTPEPQMLATPAPVARAAPEPEPEPVMMETPSPEDSHLLEQAEPAGFLVEFPAIPAVADTDIPEGPAPEAALQLEPCLTSAAAPVLVDGVFESAAYDLSSASLVSLPLLAALASPVESTVHDAPAVPREFEPSRLMQSAQVNGMSRRALPFAGSTVVEIAPRRVEFQSDGGRAQPLDFRMVTQVGNFPTWELPVTSADFPEEDADVIVGPWSSGGDRELWMVPVEDAGSSFEEASAELDASPRAALEALSRLHQDIAQTAIMESAGAGSMGAPAATLVAEPPEQAAEEVHEEGPGHVIETQAAVIDAPRPSPGQVTELMEVAVKTFGPAKPSPMSGEPLFIRPAALLPRLSALPLRPKVALAPEYGAEPALKPEPKPEPEPQVKPAAAAPRVKVPIPSKPSVKPSPVPLKAAQPKPAAPAAKSKAAPVAAEAPKPAPTEKTETVPLASKSKEPVAASQVAVKSVEAKPAPQAPTKEIATEKPARKTATAASTSPLSLKLDAAPPAQADDDLLPSFGSVQASQGFLGSLKLKLGIGIVLIAAACTAYLGWGTKAHKPAPVSDGAGPSIIIGEGGWVEGWGGDPSNVHAGREITLYRPSLKLADYRIEFQGKIETKSLGWVFRAADPQNYYAMKLTQVSSGLSPKVELFKYLVANGRQTQVGRVPIDLPVRPDTNFNVRVDVRGPQFTTYLQGQQVDVWTDDQLKTGGVGLLNEREERAQVKAVSIRILNEAGK